MFIVHLFFCVGWICMNWSWNLSLVMITNCIWDVSKLDIRTFFSRSILKVMEMVTVRCNCFLTSTDWFAWSKISLKLFTLTWFCWFLTCVYWIYWISVHWHWHMYLGGIKNYLWDVSKSETRIYFPCRFVEGCGEGAGGVIALAIINWLTGLKSIIPSYTCWFLFLLVLEVE